MIQTVQFGGKRLLESFEEHRGAAPDLEDALLRLTAFFDDLCATVVDTRQEFDEVRAKIPEQLLFRVFEKDGRWGLLHGRVDALPPSNE